MLPIFLTPGPTPLPIIGNLLYIAREHPVSYIALHRISKKYGNITSLKIGSDNIGTQENHDYQLC